MAYFAKLDKNNLVTEVMVAKTIEWLIQNLDGNWIETNPDNSIRKNYAGIGYTYDSVRDAFIPPKPFESWVLNEDTCQWEAPTPMPTDGKIYNWDEATTSWVEVTI